MPRDYLQFHWSSSPNVVLHRTEHDDHGSKFVVIDGGEIVLAGERYRFEQIHTHRPSEHLLDSRQFPAEIHLVHQSLSRRRYAVLGVFLDEEAGPAPVPELLAAVASHSSPSASSDAERAEGCLDCLLPEPRTFFRYQGSLTTEPYDELVSWVVFDTPLAALSRTVAQGTPGKARPRRDWDHRIVLRCTPP